LKGTVLKKRLLLALTATVIIGGLFFWLVDLDQVVTQLRQADWRYLVVGIIGLLAGYILMAVRWRYMLGNRISFYQAFHTNNLGNLVNSLTPIPEVAVRVFLTGRSTGISISSATSGTVVERSLEQVMRGTALLLAVLTGYVISFKTGSLLINTGLVLGFFLLVTWLLQRAGRVITWGQIQLSRLPWLDRQRASHIMSDFIEGLAQAGGSKQLTSGWIMSLGAWGFFFTFTFLVLLGMNIQLPMEQMVAIALLTLAVAPPSAPGTPGLYQATIVGALSLIAGFNPVQITAYAIMVHIMQVIPLVVLGIWGSLSTKLCLRSVYQRRMVPVGQDKGIGK
jgi:uncharacterized protein (TIRG00374 family)